MNTVGQSPVLAVCNRGIGCRYALLRGVAGLLTGSALAHRAAGQQVPLLPIEEPVRFVVMAEVDPAGGQATLVQ